MILFANIFILFILIAINAFFVAVEFAVVSARKARIQVLAEEGDPVAQTVKGWLENHAARDRMIAASQIGVTMASLAVGAMGEKTFAALLEPYFNDIVLPPVLEFSRSVFTILPLVLSLIIITSIHVVLGEQVPKVATLYDPEKVAMSLAPPMQIFMVIFKWFVDALDWTTRKVLALFGLKTVSAHSLALTVDELKQMLDESEEKGVIAGPEREMLDAIFDFNKLLARQIITPRTEIIAIEADTLFHDIIPLTTEYPYTKYPVFEDNLDHILGILHVKDLMLKTQDPDCRQCTARDLAREALFIPESISVMALLREFRVKHQHIAIVLEEFGGTAGLITLEDLLDEIIGEVNTPFDASTPPEIQLMPDGSYQIDGMLLIEAVNDELELDLKEDNYDTIAGYMLGRLGRIPNLYDKVDGEGVRLEVLAMDGMRIARVGLVRIPLIDTKDSQARN